MKAIIHRKGWRRTAQIDGIHDVAALRDTPTGP